MFLSIPLRIVYALLFENLCNDGDGGVDGVGDDENECLGCVLCDASSKVADDASVDLLVTLMMDGKLYICAINSIHTLNKSSLIASKDF